MKSFSLAAILIAALLLTISQDSMSQLNYFVPHNIPVTTYTVDLEFNFNDNYVEGNGNIKFKNTGTKPIHVIALDYSINDYNLISLHQAGIVLNAHNPDDRAQVNTPVYFELDQPLPAGADLSLELRFKRNLNLSPNFQTFESQSIIPVLWWDGITHSKQFAVKVNTDQNLSMAIGGRLNQESGYYENDHAKDFGFYFSRKGKVLQEIIAGVQVRVLYPPNGQKVASLALETAGEAIPFYIDLMGYYPYSFINIIPGGPGVWGGYPFASGMVVIHGMQYYDKGSDRHWRWITAHEIGHEFWGEYVLDKDDPPFLWIALGIYADWKFSQHVGLSDSKHRNWAEMFLSGIKKGYNTTMDIRPQEEALLGFDRNNYVIHAKGFAFISALEMVMGKEKFQDAYVTTLSRYGGRRLGNNDFQLICEESSGENLDWFFDAWLRSNKYLSAFVGNTTSVLENGKYTSTVSVYHESDFFMPVPVYATFDDGTFQVKMTDRVSRKSVVHFMSSSKLSGAVIDPSGCLANLDEVFTQANKDVNQKIDELPYSGAGDKSYLVYRMAMNADKEQIADNWFKLGIVLYDAAYYKQSRYAFKYALQYGPEDDIFINKVWLGNLYDILGDRERALSYYQEAIDIWDGGVYTHSQFNLTINEAWLNDRLEKPFSRGRKLSW